MQAFEYARPTSAREAVKLMAGGDAEALAGGGDLLSRMKDGVGAPHRLVSLRDARDLHGIDYQPAGGLRLGAMVTLAQIEEHPAIRQHYAALVHAVDDLGGPQIRNTATVGGNLCQRPRCWYYRSGFGLLGQQDGKSLIPGGDNRYHAILGNSGPAYFVSPTSLGPVFIALGARIKLLGPQGARELPAEQFFVIPKSESDREFALAPGEIITDVMVPPAKGVSACYEVRQKAHSEWPMAVAAVSLQMTGHTVKSARVVLGQTAPIPWPSPEAEQALAGKTISEEVAEAAGAAAVAEATPLSRNAYKVTLTKVAVKRAVLRAAGKLPPEVD